VWWWSVWSKFSSEWAGVNGKGCPGLCSCLSHDDGHQALQNQIFMVHDFHDLHSCCGHNMPCSLLSIIA
jgi:hypothetical protein